jgi:hypothetical protein
MPSPIASRNCCWSEMIGRIRVRRSVVCFNGPWIPSHDQACARLRIHSFKAVFYTAEVDLRKIRGLAGLLPYASTSTANRGRGARHCRRGDGNPARGATLSSKPWCVSLAPRSRSHPGVDGRQTPCTCGFWTSITALPSSTASTLRPKWLTNPLRRIPHCHQSLGAFPSPPVHVHTQV